MLFGYLIRHCRKIREHHLHLSIAFIRTQSADLTAPSSSVETVALDAELTLRRCTRRNRSIVLDERFV